MSGYTDRNSTPSNDPAAYRPATMQDVLGTSCGFVTIEGDYWRRNGAIKLWKRSPNRFRLPVKYGMYGYDYVDNGNIWAFYVRLEEVD